MLRRLAASMLLLALAGCGTGVQCDNKVRDTLVAPDGLHGAILFTRDCGAATALTTQLSILNAGEELGDIGNAYVADGGTMESDAGGPWADARWIDNSHLHIRIAPRSRIFKQEREVVGVTISYQQVRG